LDTHDDTTPRPDPTSLTTDQLLRETHSLRDLMRAELKSEVDLTAERFASVATHLSLSERQRVEQKKDTKDAVDAALAAAKEAVKEQTTASERAIAKSEAATTKQLEQLTATFNTAIKGVTDLLNDSKDRLSRMEAIKQGGKDTYTSLYAVLGAGLTLLVIVDLLLAWFKK
jgi:ribosomal protein L7/L12